MMAMVRLNKRDLQEIVLWGVSYKMKCEDVDVKFEKDEIDTLVKVGKARDKAWNYEKGLFEENHIKQKEVQKRSFGKESAE